VAKTKFIIKIIFSSNRELNASPTGTQQLPLGQHSQVIVELIFRIINPVISNETDKTSTDPDPAVLFHLTWIFAGMNLIDQLLSKCKPSTSSSTDETVSEFTLDSELPPTPPPKTKAKRGHESKPRNPLLPPCYIHTAGLKRTAKNKNHAASPTGHSARGPGGMALLGRPP
jgi:hypothetical protein